MDYLTSNIDYLTSNVDYLTSNVEYLTSNVDYLTLKIDYLTLNIDYLTLIIDYCRSETEVSAVGGTDQGYVLFCDPAYLLLGYLLEFLVDQSHSDFFGLRRCVIFQIF